MIGQAASPLLALTDISRRYGAVQALHGVSATVPAGQVVALCGDNGAGKSTLVRILSGAQPPSGGQITLRGRPVAFSNPADALRQGVATIYQDLALVPRMDVAQNVFLGAEPRRRVLGLPVLDKRHMRAEAARHLARLRVGIPDLRAEVGTLSGGQRQAVAIARALRGGAEIVIMDEPTAALGVVETRQVLDLILDIKAQGLTVLLVSHNMRDVMEVADRALILRGGRLVRDTDLAGWDADRLAMEIMRRS